MTLAEIKQVVSELSDGERAELRAFIDSLPTSRLSKEERLRRFHSFVNYIQDTMTPEQIEEAVAAMNEEYIEPWDEDEWTF
jgi:DNA-binding transcriptional regulator YbjK